MRNDAVYDPVDHRHPCKNIHDAAQGEEEQGALQRLVENLVPISIGAPLQMQCVKSGELPLQTGNLLRRCERFAPLREALRVSCLHATIANLHLYQNNYALLSVGTNQAREIKLKQLFQKSHKSAKEAKELSRVYSAHVKATGRR